ncbi:ectonucleotide pyrophosphatase/phosphodiesterase family member 7 [Lingula anatina]|uniref:Ectonucleotide pyrophosphatase/phosphodiesterase family member 7 n=1 Tax=Lingula anatina TaxID=7574 RepID=A0A1S3ITY0_LINAN|nr:ectonucleotide pyrophosphatase/phosphodiesterase family member 7 [Lingula anatina]|eukprot:XP_013401538.1 ectonucleotide pyrophosphatase/phosphodiesterase family member 7 [Lingula anatina]
MKQFVICFAALVNILPVIAVVLSQETQQLLLVSFDGFRWDYLDKVDTPNFDRMARRGVKAKYMTPAFPTLTLPAHHTIATGLYPESHGVVHNIMYDPDLNETITRETRNESKWWDTGPHPYGLQPGRKSATFNYYGGEVKIKNYTATYFVSEDPVNSSVTREEGVKAAIAWLTEGVAFVAVHFSEPDHVGHAYGPDSDEVKQQITNADETLGRLLDKIEASQLSNKVNIIVTSDHGMANIYRDKKVQLYDFINPDDVTYIVANYGPLAMILPREGRLEPVLQLLQNASVHMKVYRKENVPNRLHFSSNNRILPIIAMTEDPWEIFTVFDGTKLEAGGHGFDNDDVNMRTIFLAEGPSFKKNLIVDPFESVQLYELMCHVIGLNPAPNNGSLEVLRSMLLDSETNAAVLAGTANALAGFIACGLIWILH